MSAEGLPLAREVRLQQLRVHQARVGTKYVRRDMQSEFAESVGRGRAALLVGHSMAGKTRLAAEVIKREHGDSEVFIPESGKSLRALVAQNWDPDGVVIWLDDLERFLTSDGLTPGLLDRLVAANAIVVATMRTAAMKAFRPLNGVRPPEWDVIRSFRHTTLRRRLSNGELARVRAAVDNPDVLSAINQYGLAEYLGAGPECLNRYEEGETVCPLGHYLVRAAADWRRTGLSRPIPKRVLAEPEVIGAYLRQREDVPRTKEAIEEGLTWATERVNETVSLLTPLFDEGDEPHFDVFDYLLDQLSSPGAESVPEAMWRVALREVRPTEWRTLSVVANVSGQGLIAEEALQRAVEEGDTVAMTNLGWLLRLRNELLAAQELWLRAAEMKDAGAMAYLGALCQERGDDAKALDWWHRAIELDSDRAMAMLGLWHLKQGSENEGEPWLRRAASAGNAMAMFVLGLRLYERGVEEEAEEFWRRAADASNPEAMNGLGMISATRGDTAPANSWFRRAAELGNTAAMMNIASSLRLQGKSEEAETWVRQAANLGDAGAMITLAETLQDRDHTSLAEIWFRRAADVGVPHAMFHVAQYQRNLGDVSGTEDWLRRGADAGDLAATMALSLFLEEREEHDEAESWLKRVADQDDVDAIMMLAERHMQRGEIAEAESWWRRAAAQGESIAAGKLAASQQNRGLHPEFLTKPFWPE